MSTTRRSFMLKLGSLGAMLGLSGCAVTDANAAPQAALPTAGPPMPPIPAGTLSKSFWNSLRPQFLLSPNEAFFNTGTAGASPRTVLNAVIDHLVHVDRDLAHWDYKPGGENYYSGYYPEEPLRKKFATLMNADMDEIAITANSTYGLNALSNGLSLDPGDEVIVMEAAHIGGRCGWELKAKRYNTVVKYFKPPFPPTDPAQLIALYENLTTTRTKVWQIPHLTSHAAVRFPVEELCKRARARNIITVIDGAQTLGHLVIDVKAMGCDAFFSSPHKFLLAPKGTGVLYIRRDLHPKVWTTLASAQWDNQTAGIYKLMQYGTTNMSLLKGVEAAIDLHLALQPARIQQRIVGLGDYLRAGLQKIPNVEIKSSAHPDLKCATITYILSNMDSQKVTDELWARAKIRVRRQDNGMVRQCCHIYNSEQEIDRTLEVLTQLART